MYLALKFNCPAYQICGKDKLEMRRRYAVAVLNFSASVAASVVRWHVA